MTAPVLRPSRPEDLPALQEIYQEAFGDPEDYTRMYFQSNLFTQGGALVLEADGAVQSAFHRLAGPSLEGRPLTYLYALGTRAAARGKGYGAAVVSACFRQGLEQGAPGCLCPASPSLHVWYREKAGAEPLFSVREDYLSAASVPSPPDGWRCTPVEGRSYARLRELLLSGKPHVSFPDRFWDWQELSCRYSGGALALLDCGALVGAAIVQREDEETLSVKELLLPEADMGAAAKLLAHYFGAKRAYIRSPLFWRGMGGKARPFVVGRLPEGEAIPPEAWWGPVFD